MNLEREIIPVISNFHF
uniref:Uncharacterized protein n=1 Tax=Arundo donax TaxID=35708 RepID=A0A0A8YXS9_ARUDO